jgi:hypothetical protein
MYGSWYGTLRPLQQPGQQGMLGISDPFGSSLLPANPAGGSSSGSFRPVAAHGNKDGALAGGL